MKMNEFITETFQTVTINGISRSLNNDEKRIYTKIKDEGKVLKTDFNEYDQRIASDMVTKGLLCRKKNPQHEIYFITKGRRKCAINKPLDEVAPPDTDIEKWIEDNKDRFKEKYGKQYGKYLYGKAWNKFNGKKVNESFYHKRRSEFADSGIMFDDDYIDFQKGMSFIDENGIKWTIEKIFDDPDKTMILRCENPDENGFFNWARTNQEFLNTDIFQLEKYKPVFDEKFYDVNDGSNEINEVLRIAGVKQLNEGIADILKYYPKIPEEKVKELVALDPTYKGGDQLGKFGKWILNIYNRGNLKEEDFYKVKDYLTTFKMNYNKIANKDLNTYKGLPELYTAIEPYIGQQDVSHRQEVMNIKQGAEKVFEDDNWLVIVPHTEEASCYYGKGTQWCTAATKSGNMFNYYNNQGPLYININKKTNEKFQFHFETNSFMDERDKEINFKEFLNNNPDLKKFYLNLLLKTPKKYALNLVMSFGYTKDENINRLAVQRTGWAIQFIENPSEELQRLAVQQYGRAIKFIENPSEEVQRLAVQQEGRVIMFIKNPSEEVQRLAVQHEIDAIRFIKKPSKELQRLAVQQNGYAIEYIENPSEELQVMAVRQDGYVIRYIENPSEEVQKLAVQQDGRAIQFIEKPSKEVLRLAIRQDGYAIGYIKKPSKELQRLAVRQNGGTIQFIENPSEELQRLAVRHHEYNIRFIKNPSEEVQRLAVQKNGDAIRFIEKPSKEVQRLVVRQDGDAIRYIKKPSKELQRLAVQQNGEYIKYIKNPSEELQKLAVQQNGEYIRYIERPSEEVQKLAVQQDRNAFYHIYNPTEKVRKLYNKLTGKVNDEINEVLRIAGVKQLNEGIADILKYYPKIPEEKVKELVALDPTYKGGDQLGKFGKWILNIYNRGNLKEEDFYKVKDYLSTFKMNYNKMTNKDLNTYKSLPELYTAIEPYIGQQDVSHRQEVMNIKQGAEKVFEDDNWLVIIPHTEEASCYYGKGTQWCTAATKSENMFNDYNDEGPLYININKKTHEKFQFHFETSSFMDENDKEINFKEFINNNQDLKKFYLNLLLKTPKKYAFALVKYFGYIRDENINRLAVQQNGEYIKYIKNPSEEVQRLAVQKHGAAIRHIENPSEEVQKLAVQKNSDAIRFIKNPSEEVQKLAVQKDGEAIIYIKNPSEEVQKLAVQEHDWLFKYIKNPSEEVQRLAVQKDGDAIAFIKNPSEEVQKLAVQQNGRAIRYIKNPTEKVKRLAVQQNEYAIEYIENPSEELQRLAVQQNSDAFKYIKNPTEKVRKLYNKLTGKVDDEINEVLRIAGVEVL